MDIDSLEEYEQEVRSKKKKNKKGNYQFTLFLLMAV